MGGGLEDVVVDGLSVVVVEASGVSARAVTLGNVRPVKARMTAKDAAIDRQILRMTPPELTNAVAQHIRHRVRICGSSNCPSSGLLTTPPPRCSTWASRRWSSDR